MNFVVSSFVKHSPGIWCENLGESAILKLSIQCYCIFALSWLYIIDINHMIFSVKTKLVHQCHWIFALSWLLLQPLAYFPSWLGNNKDYGEEEGGDQSESAGALFMYQMKLFPTLDSYMSRRRDKVSQTVHAKIENRIEALMKERYKKFFLMLIPGFTIQVDSFMNVATVSSHTRTSLFTTHNNLH